MSGIRGISDSKRWTFGIVYVAACFGMRLGDFISDNTFSTMVMPIVAILVVAQTYKDVKA